MLAQLLELNLAVAALEKRGKPVTAAGIPPSHPNPQRLVTTTAFGYERPKMTRLRFIGGLIRTDQQPIFA